MPRDLTAYVPRSPSYSALAALHRSKGRTAIAKQYDRLAAEYKLTDQLVEAVRYYKTSFKWTLRDLAQAVGVSPATVSNDLNGNVNVPGRLLTYLDAMEVEWEFRIL